jgi:hypothetical protein
MRPRSLRLKLKAAAAAASGRGPGTLGTGACFSTVKAVI